jgi:hypothetical protein
VTAPVRTRVRKLDARSRIRWIVCSSPRAMAIIASAIKTGASTARPTRQKGIRFRAQTRKVRPRRLPTSTWKFGFPPASIAFRSIKLDTAAA